MVKKIFCVVVLLLLILPVVFAYKTEITVKTQPKKLVSINVYDSKTEDKLIPGIFERTTMDGIYSINISTLVKEIDIEISSKDDKNAVIGSENFDSYTAGGKIYLDFTAPAQNASEENETAELLSNETISTTNESSQENVTEESSKSLISGFFIKDIKDFFSKRVYYIVGIIAVIIILFFLFSARDRIFGGIGSLGGSKKIVTRKLSNVMEEKASMEREDMVAEKEIMGAERKIKEAQEEINKIKNKRKIAEIEKELQERKEFLEKLRKGEI